MSETKQQMNELMSSHLSFSLFYFQLVCKQMEEELYEACRHGRDNEVKSILINHPNLNINWKNENHFGFTSLLVACECGHSSVVSILLAHPDINVNQKRNNGSTPFLYACINDYSSVVELLLKDARVLINE